MTMAVMVTQTCETGDMRQAYATNTVRAGRILTCTRRWQVWMCSQWTVPRGHVRISVRIRGGALPVLMMMLLLLMMLLLVRDMTAMLTGRGTATTTWGSCLVSGRRMTSACVISIRHGSTIHGIESAP